MHILVPVKNTTHAKSRLAGLLTPGQRRALTLAMLRDVLTALTKSSAGNSADCRIHIVSDDRLVKEISLAFRVGFIEDATTGDLNATLRGAVEHLRRRGASTLWILPADLPRIIPEDIDALLCQHGSGPAMTIAPAERDRGTNALGLNPPGLIDFSFGPESFEKHCAAARVQCAELFIVRRPGLAFDLDTQQDLTAFAKYQSESFTGKLIAGWSLEA